MIRKTIIEIAFAAICAMTAFGAAPAWDPEADPPPPPPPPSPAALAEEIQRSVRMSIGGGGSFLGVGVAEVDSERAKALKLREERGVEVTNIEDGSPAAKAGLQKGDVVLEFNGQRVEGTEQFVRLVRETPAGREVKLTISRGGATQTVAATIGRRGPGRMPEGMTGRRFVMPDINVHMPDIPKAYMSWRSPMLGVEAEAVDSQLAEYFGVKEGVLVRSVMKGSAAEKAGLKAGDVITKLDTAKVTSPRDITNAVRSKRGGTFPVTLMRERKEMTLSVTVEEQKPGTGRQGPEPRRARPVRSEHDEKL